MTITLNGEPFTVEEPSTIGTLLTSLAIDPRRVAVERNFAIVKRERYDDTDLRDGDRDRNRQLRWRRRW